MANEAQLSEQSLNNDVRDWAHDNAADLLDEIETLNIIDEGNLYRKLRYKLGYSYGVVEKASYGFPRYGVFVAKGVGRGRPIGSESARKHARDWFNSVLDRNLPELADRVQQHQADLTIRSIKIK